MNPLKNSTAFLLALGLGLGPLASAPAFADCGGQSFCAEMLRDMQREREAREAEEAWARADAADRAARKAQAATSSDSSLAADVVGTVFLLGVGALLYTLLSEPERPKAAAQPMGAAPAQPPRQPGQQAAR